MEENKIMTPQLKGIIIALLLIVVGIAAYFTELAFQRWFNWVVNGIFCAAIIVACIYYANQKDGYVTFGNVFGHGFKVTLVATVIILIYSIIASTILFPEMKEKIFEIQQTEMEKRDMSEEQVEKTMSMMKKYFTLFMILGVIFSYLVTGCIGSLLGAAFAKKKPINPLQQNM